MTSNVGGAHLLHGRFNRNVAAIRELYFPDGTIKLAGACENLVCRHSRLPSAKIAWFWSRDLLQLELLEWAISKF
jgi:hypothetical protein